MSVMILAGPHGKSFTKIYPYFSLTQAFLDIKGMFAKCSVIKATNSSVTDVFSPTAHCKELNLKLKAFI